MCLGKVVLWLRAACGCVIRAWQLSWSTSALSTEFRRTALLWVAAGRSSGLLRACVCAVAALLHPRPRTGA